MTAAVIGILLTAITISVVHNELALSYQQAYAVKGVLRDQLQSKLEHCAAALIAVQFELHVKLSGGARSSRVAQPAHVVDAGPRILLQVAIAVEAESGIAADAAAAAAAVASQAPSRATPHRRCCGGARAKTKAAAPTAACTAAPRPRASRPRRGRRRRPPLRRRPSTRGGGSRTCRWCRSNRTTPAAHPSRRRTRPPRSQQRLPAPTSHAPHRRRRRARVGGGRSPGSRWRRARSWCAASRARGRAAHRGHRLAAPATALARQRRVARLGLH